MFKCQCCSSVALPASLPSPSVHPFIPSGGFCDCPVIGTALLGKPAVKLLTSCARCACIYFHRESLSNFNTCGENVQAALQNQFVTCHFRMIS